MHKPRASRGGGTALIFRDGINTKQSTDVATYESFEVLECTISSNIMVRLCVIYRPPGLTSIKAFCSEFSDYMSHIVTSSGHPVIIGDFNIHMQNDANTEFTSVCNSFDLKQHVVGPTHRSGNTIDLILTRSTDILISEVRSQDHGFPDHFPVFAALNFKKPEAPKMKVSYRKLKKISPGTLKEAVKQSPIMLSKTESMSVDELANLYNNELRAILDNLAPLKTRWIPIRPEPEWYSIQVRSAKQERRQAERAWRKSGLEVHKQNFMEMRNKVNNMIKQAKQIHYKELIDNNKSDTRLLFKVVNKLLGKTTHPALPTGSDDNIAEMFSDYFVDKIDNIRLSIQSAVSDDQDIEANVSVHFMQPLTTFNSVSEQAVEKIIRSSANKSCDLDPMPTELVKMALPDLLPLMTNIINKSLTSGTFPSIFKQALVTPLLKKQGLDSEIPKNFRPVSNLHFVSKVLEKIVAQQLNDHLQRNNLHEPFQSAYRQNHSTETALLRVQNDIINAIGKQKVVLLVLLDLSAAFDTVDHECLLATLQSLGVHDTALVWFHSYLTCRMQRINIKGTRSGVKNITCGVPQGSVLGPILFTIYTSSLGLLLREQQPQYHMYADDTSLYLCVKPSHLNEATQQISNCITLIQKWMCQHQLKMNEEKTEFIVISSKTTSRKISPSSLNVADSQITPSTSVRNLGVMFDQYAAMDVHVQNLCRGAYFQLKNIGALKRYLDKPSLESVVHAFVTSKLDYCNSLLCGLPSCLTTNLQRVQNTAARILTGTRKFEHITPVLRSLHWLPIDKRIIYKVLLMVYKAVHQLSPVYIQELIVSHNPSRSLRSSNQNLLHVPFTSSSLIQARAFNVAGPRYWNSLPCHIRAAPSIELFKSILKTHLFKDSFN